MDEIFEYYGQTILAVLGASFIIILGTGFFFHEIINFIAHMLTKIL